VKRELQPEAAVSFRTVVMFVTWLIDGESGERDDSREAIGVGVR